MKFMTAFSTFLWFTFFWLRAFHSTSESLYAARIHWNPLICSWFLCWCLHKSTLTKNKNSLYAVELLIKWKEKNLAALLTWNGRYEQKITTEAESKYTSWYEQLLVQLSLSISKTRGKNSFSPLLRIINIFFEISLKKFSFYASCC